MVYLLSCNVPTTKKQAIPSLQPSMTVKQSQHYQETWKKCNEMLVPLMDLVGECGHTKVTKKENQEKGVPLGTSSSANL